METEIFSAYTCDQTDKLILKTLELNAKMNYKEIASKIGLSTTPVYERIKRLERVGIIQAYTIKIDPKVLDRQLQVHCHISLSAHHNEAIGAFEQAVQHHPEIQTAYHIAGAMDYVLHIAVKDMEAYQRFLKEKLTLIPHIAHVQSNFIMTTVKA